MDRLSEAELWQRVVRLMEAAKQKQGMLARQDKDNTLGVRCRRLCKHMLADTHGYKHVGNRYANAGCDWGSCVDPVQLKCLSWHSTKECLTEAQVLEHIPTLHVCLQNLEAVLRYTCQSATYTCFTMSWACRECQLKPTKLCCGISNFNPGTLHRVIQCCLAKLCLLCMH